MRGPGVGSHDPCRPQRMARSSGRNPRRRMRLCLLQGARTGWVLPRPGQVIIREPTLQLSSSSSVAGRRPARPAPTHQRQGAIPSGRAMSIEPAARGGRAVLHPVLSNHSFSTCGSARHGVQAVERRVVRRPAAPPRVRHVLESHHARRAPPRRRMCRQGQRRHTKALSGCRPPARQPRRARRAALG